MVILSDILLLPSIIIPLFIEFLLFLLLSYSALYTLILLKSYKQNQSSLKHYRLEEKSHLITTIIFLSLLIKLALLPFFFYTLDTISTFLPGAMCSAGVISANGFGNTTVILKIFVIFVALLWLKLNKEDEKTPHQPYFRIKLYLYLFLYFSIMLELYLEFSFLSFLSTESVVECCSSLYSTSDADIFSFTDFSLLLLFTFLFLLTLILNYYKKRYISTFISSLFLLISYYTLLYIFSPYIYELPTHQCPYCMLKKEYHFVGYLIYFSLFMGFYYSLSTLFFHFSHKEYKKSSFFFLLFFLLSSGNLALYLIKNKTFLSSLF